MTFLHNNALHEHKITGKNYGRNYGCRIVVLLDLFCIYKDPPLIFVTWFFFLLDDESELGQILKRRSQTIDLFESAMEGGTTAERTSEEMTALKVWRLQRFVRQSVYLNRAFTLLVRERRTLEIHISYREAFCWFPMAPDISSMNPV